MFRNIIKYQNIFWVEVKGNEIPATYLYVEGKVYFPLKDRLENLLHVDIKMVYFVELTKTLTILIDKPVTLNALTSVFTENNNVLIDSYEDPNHNVGIQLEITIDDAI